MDIRDLLKQEHKEAVDLATRICESHDPAEARELFNELKLALTLHSRAEERVVYRALEKSDVPAAQDIGHEGEIEHSLLDHLMDQMSRGRADSDAWQARAKVLKELLTHHVTEEHEEMFPQLGRLFSAQERASMCDRFEAAKAQVAKAPVRQTKTAAEAAARPT